MAQFIVNEGGLVDSATFLVVRATNEEFANGRSRFDRVTPLQPRARRRASGEAARSDAVPVQSHEIDCAWTPVGGRLR